MQVYIITMETGYNPGKGNASLANSTPRCECYLSIDRKMAIHSREESRDTTLLAMNAIPWHSFLSPSQRRWFFFLPQFLPSVFTLNTRVYWYVGRPYQPSLGSPHCITVISLLPHSPNQLVQSKALPLHGPSLFFLSELKVWIACS